MVKTMPKPRKPQGSRKIEARMIIICEGEKNHSEHAYIEGFIKTLNINNKKIVFDHTKYNTGKELVCKAKELCEFKGDKLWVVYDKDGYTKHPETFDMAKANSINIAFSSISFEYWILIHFSNGYTTRVFEKSDDIISYMKNNCDYIYKKNDRNMYKDISKKGSLGQAESNAEKIQKYQLIASPGVPIYKLNPYTDMDKLTKDIKNFIKEK